MGAIMTLFTVTLLVLVTPWVALVGLLVIGGGSQIYRAFLPQVNRIYLTRIHAEVAGDAFFPQITWSNWVEVYHQNHRQDERHPFAFAWIIRDKISGI